jgi:hypothetical protein
VRLFGALALLLVAVPAAATTTTATSLVATLGAPNPSTREFQLQGALALTRSGWSLSGDALASRRAVDDPLGESALGVTLGAPLVYGLSIEGLVNERFFSDESPAQQGFGGARLVAAADRARWWAGYGSTRLTRGPASGAPVLQTGGEATIGRLSLSASLARSTTAWHVSIPGQRAIAADTLVILTPDEEETRRSVGNTVRLGTTWSATRWSLGTMGGVRWESALSTERWLRVEGAWWMRPRLALRLGLGREVADPWQVGSARHGTSLAVEWTTPHWERRAQPMQAKDAVALRVVHLSGDLYRIEVVAPHIGRVEAMGDFTAWEIVELRRASGGRFVLELHIPPGVYRVQVRCDGGAWMIPSNLPGMDDPDLGGAGTLVVE